MKLLSSTPFWPIRDGLMETYPPLGSDTRCDVAVIGAGITGAFVAWRLAEAGVDTLVLDGRDAGHGSTAGTTSLLQYELDEPLHRLARRFGREFADRCYRRCCDAIDEIGALVREHDLACDYEPKPSLLVASRAAHVDRLRSEFEAREATGLAVEWWTRSRLARESTLPHPAAILSREAAQVDAYRLAHGLFAAARKRGARIYDRTLVTRTIRGARGVELRTNRGFRVWARRLVIAAGYEAEAFLPRPVTKLVSTYAIISEPVNAFVGWPARRALIWETARPYLYLRTTADNRIIIGGADQPFRDPDARDRLVGVKARLLERRLRRLFPRIPFETAYAWAGTFANTAHGLPFIGPHPELAHTLFALGYGGNGVTFSALAGGLIRDHVLARPNRDAELFGFGRTPDGSRLNP